ncbi:MAG TPA: hypothetical protein VI670_01620 [Thermoanaerobaculia bacterium]
MQDTSNELLVSVISAWEIAVKQSLGKLDFTPTRRGVAPGDAGSQRIAGRPARARSSSTREDGELELLAGARLDAEPRQHLARND